MENSNSILMTFDMIYDIDIGIFKLIKEKYNNPAYMNQSMLNMSNNSFKYSMLNSEVYDPISILMNDEYKFSAITLLGSILGQEYSDVVRLSEPTNILSLSSVYLKSSLVNVTILCKTIEESVIIKNNAILKSVSVLVEPDYSKIKLDKYDSLFIKIYKDTLKFKELFGKSIFIGNYRFNQEKESSVDTKMIPSSVISVLVGDTNRLYFIDPYIIDNSYPIYG